VRVRSRPRNIRSRPFIRHDDSHRDSIRGARPGDKLNQVEVEEHTADSHARGRGENASGGLEVGKQIERCAGTREGRSYGVVTCPDLLAGVGSRDRAGD
jgi:hypothetical protein